MNTTLRRWLLAMASALLLLTAVMHTLAFVQTRAAAAASNLAPFFGQSFQALWLIESVTLVTLSVVFGLVAARPAMASGALVAILAFVPACSALLVAAPTGTSKGASWRTEERSCVPHSMHSSSRCVPFVALNARLMEHLSFDQACRSLIRHYP